MHAHGTDPHLRETATAPFEVRGPDGAAPLPIDTQGAAAPKREAPSFLKGRDGAPPPSDSLRRSRPHLRETATAPPQVRSPDGARRDYQLMSLAEIIAKNQAQSILQ
ncbi:MAG: hypothetical protein B9S31_03810 [Spartobacteria bacterium Tous-C9RFEB]|nr:MAG: hypothetical protein B9S31_03810 [Spartobacteria bacterium Tous-C9RFEB]